MATSTSREHTDEFLRRERRATQGLRNEWGAEGVAKLDRILVRELLYERKEAELARAFDDTSRESPKYEVMINARSGRRVTSSAKPRGGERERRRHVGRMRRSGELSLTRLRTDLESREVPVLASFWLTHSVLARTSPEQLEHAAARGDVHTINANKRMLVSSLDTSRALIQADQVANNLGIDGTGVSVAIVDTGVDTTHPALAGVVTAQLDQTGLGTGDGFGHGTHCAGIVASQDGTFRGIAPGASLIDIRIMDASGSSTPAIAVSGLQTAVTSGARVASNSWGWTHADGFWVDPDGTCVLCAAANAAVAAGVVVVVSAGNDDNDTCSTYDSHISCPANASDVITVGATDKKDQMADFSSIGPTPDGRAKPDVVAPGVSINSCKAAGTDLATPIDPAGLFIPLDGTSMACPHVAGVAALMLERNPRLTPAQVKGILMDTAVDIGAPPEQMGSGRVDALAAVNAS